MDRYVIEGEWSGYTSSQRRICHRMIIRYPERYRQLKTIKFTDGTTLELSVRKCLHRERVKEIRGYVDLIEESLKKNKSFVLVSELE